MRRLNYINSLFLMLVALTFTLNTLAQAPEKMSYQAVIRDNANNLVVTSTIGMQISILQGTSNGTSVYTETQSAMSNSNGLVSIQIGEGTIISGDFNTIDWSNGPFFIRTETDPTGGSNYTITGTSELLSVPYALYAKNSGNSTPGPQGPQGVPGNDGNGIASTTDNGDGTFTFTYDDGSTFTTSNLTGPQGAQGIQGIQGVQGPIGATGANGNGIVSTSDNGDGTFTFTYDDGSTFTTSDLTGPQGVAGLSGGYNSVALFDLPGTYNWTAPIDVEYIKVKIWSASGGGGGGASNITYTVNWTAGNTSSWLLFGAYGGGGGAGGYGEEIINVIPGQTYIIIVGEKGYGGVTNTAGTNGEDSSFDSFTVFGGQGGQSGLAGSRTASGYAEFPSTGGLGGAGGYSNFSLNSTGDNGTNGSNGYININSASQNYTFQGEGGDSSTPNNYDYCGYTPKGGTGGTSPSASWNPTFGNNTITLSSFGGGGTDGENGQVLIYY